MRRSKVLIIGDSISMGYEAAVREALADVAEVVRNPGNGSDSANAAAHIDEWLGAVKPNIVVLNCGLHDVKRNRATGAYQVPLEQYRSNLEFVADRVQAAGCRLVWVTTTPVIEVRHQASRDFDRLNADIDAYNAAAEGVLRGRVAGVVPLHVTAREMGLEASLKPDGVHFTDEGSGQLGGRVAAALLPIVAPRG